MGWVLKGMAAVVAVLMAASVAGAQTGLETRLREGDRVSVSGPEIGRVGGRFTRLTQDSLTVETDTGERQISLGQVDRIKRTRFGVLLGTIIGAGVGVAFAIPLNMLIEAEGGNATGDTAKLLALTTGIGFGIDAAINIPRTVYRRDQQPRVQIAPQVGPHGGGVALRVTF